MPSMDKRLNTVLLFSKLPEPGLVKTRLSFLKDGVFDPEDASELFECMLLDVIETILCAFDAMSKKDASPGDSEKANAYELVVSTAPAKNEDAMRELLTRNFDGTRFPIKVITDFGKSFDEHYNDAFAKVWQMGSSSIVSMGADMPALTPDDIIRAFKHLQELYNRQTDGIVLAPDQEMGVSAVGWNSYTSFDHTGVYYNASGLTVLPAYIEKARANNIEVNWLPPIPDVDTMADLSHNITLIDALKYCHEANSSMYPVWPRRTFSKLEELGCSIVRVPPNTLYDPRDIIDS